jgi:hypothetical protein
MDVTFFVPLRGGVAVQVPRIVSIIRDTLSGLASGVMPWPRLKICGPLEKAFTTWRVAAISAWPPVTMCSGARLPCTQPSIWMLAAAHSGLTELSTATQSAPVRWAKPM